ncbi:mask, partial [Symbiodinium sp. CCMP2456]
SPGRGTDPSSGDVWGSGAAALDIRSPSPTIIWSAWPLASAKTRFCPSSTRSTSAEITMASVRYCMSSRLVPCGRKRSQRMTGWGMPVMAISGRFARPSRQMQAPTFANRQCRFCHCAAFRWAVSLCPERVTRSTSSHDICAVGFMDFSKRCWAARRKRNPGASVGSPRP